ncbi:hypothetical protein [cf. Phormidesmis sp. LEGE 11477]|uniref:hypothetical protein n=1 Tax=cf. Phormidesmis sp. LEGE 11477 TaxID=1828680 RepID=UPI00187E1E3C|nr:hypothetical protein [cf. Phormidesmis sp. LEGE 11477]MBE9062591.1 hypothetical protein [cf. Phormidesmis sp. LEGE 11477]
MSSFLQVQVAWADVPENPIADIDVPEEILRTEIIVEARSPLTGELLTAAEYAQLQASLEREGRSPQLRSDIRQLVYLLRLRRILKPVIPFIKEQPAISEQPVISEQPQAISPTKELPISVEK